MLRKIFGQKRVETMGDWRKLQNEALRDLYSSPNTVPVIKLRGMRWTGHVAGLLDNKMHIGFWVRKAAREEPLVRSRHRWGIIFTYFLK